MSLLVLTMLPSYLEDFRRAASEVGVPLEILCGICWRETKFGTAQACIPKGPSCKGDNGHGHGLFQIDDRTWETWLRLNNWFDPYVSAKKAATIFKDEWDFFGRFPQTHVCCIGPKTAEKLGVKEGVYTDVRPLTEPVRTQAALAAYNAGRGRVLATLALNRDADLLTTGADYGRDVMWRAEQIKQFLVEREGVVA